MERIPEPELMLDPEQASAYAEADFSSPHAHFVELLLQKLARLPAVGSALDLGCGPGDITIRVARALPDWQVLGLDASPAMLKLAESAIAAAELASHVTLKRTHLPVLPRWERGFDLAYANSLLHHLRCPDTLWSTLKQAAAHWRPGTQAFVMDLMRPERPEDVEALVGKYAQTAPPVLQRDFRASLYAAYTPAEVRAQLQQAGLSALDIEVVSDRHFIVWGDLPSQTRDAATSAG